MLLSTCRLHVMRREPQSDDQLPCRVPHVSCPRESFHSPVQILICANSHVGVQIFIDANLHTDVQIARHAILRARVKIYTACEFTPKSANSHERKFAFFGANLHA